MKTWLKLSLLLGVILLLAGVGYWDEWKSEIEKKEELQSNRLFGSLDASAVKQLKFKSQINDLEVELTKSEEGQWFIKNPLEAKADDKVVNSLVKQVVDFKFEKDLGEKPVEGFDEFGLDSPEIILTLNEEDQYTMLVGNKTPVGFNRYVNIGSNRNILVAGGFVHSSLNKKLYELRDKTIQLPSQSQLESLTLVNDEEISFKRANENWVLDSESSPRVDEDSFSDFIAYWRKNVFEQILDEPSKALAKALRLNNKGTELVASLRWKTVGGTEQSWQFIENNGELYAKKINDDSIYRVSKEAREQLDKSLWDFQYKKVIDFDSNSAVEVSINDELYKKKNGVWENKNGEPKDFVQSMLIDLEYSNALELKPSSEFDLRVEKRVFNIVIRLDNETQIKFGVFKSEKDPATLLVKKDGEDVAYVVADSFIENFEDRQIAKAEDEGSQG